MSAQSGAMRGGTLLSPRSADVQMDRYVLTAGNRRPGLPKFRVRWNYVTRWSRATCWHDAFREPTVVWLATSSWLTARENWLLRGGGHGRPAARDQAPRPPVAAPSGTP